MKTSILFLICFFVSGMFMQAQTSELKKLSKDLLTECAQDVSDIEQFNYLEQACKFTTSYYSVLNGFSLSMSFGTEGHEIDGNTSKYGINMSAGASKGFYPNEVNFQTGIALQYQDGEIIENMTILVLNFEHYFNNYLEAYVFLEKFSDDYMNIRERYEVGGGIKFEKSVNSVSGSHPFSAQLADYKNYIKSFDYYITRITEKIRRRQELILFLQELLYKRDTSYIAALEIFPKEFTNFLTGIKKIISTGETEEFKTEKIKKLLEGKIIAERSRLAGWSKVIGTLKVLKTKTREVHNGLIKKYSPFSIGVAFSLFSEIETASIEREVSVTDNDAETVPFNRDFTISENPFLRFVIRPKITIRLTSDLTFKSFFYWKLRLKDFSDNRIDMQAILNYRPRMKINWAKGVGVSLSYEYHYDSDPPLITDESIQALVDENLTLSPGQQLTAPKRHHKFSLGFTINF